MEMPERAGTGGGERRPIAARDTGLAAALAGWLIRHRASPNGISGAGMACGLLAGLALAGTWWWPGAARPLWLAGALLIQLRLLANLMDGMVAIGRGIASPVGELCAMLARVAITARAPAAGLIRTPRRAAA